MLLEIIIYIFNNNGKRIERKVMMDYEDYINPYAGTKFKKGDIVKLKKEYNNDKEVSFYLEVV